MDNSFSVSVATVKSSVRAQLSVIGKHHATQPNSTLFSTTTLSSLESSVMDEFVRTAVQLVVSALTPVLSVYSSSTSFKFSVNSSRWGNALPVAVQDAVQSFIVASVVQSCLNMTVPDIAPRYSADAQNMLTAIVSMVFTKQPPVKSASSLADCHGSVSLK